MTMTPQVMITNGGPHPADKWAETTVGQIMQVGSNPAGRKLELAFLIALEDAFRTAQETERAALAAEGASRLLLPIEPVPAAQEAFAALLAAARETEFADHFDRPDAQAHIVKTIGQNLGTAIYIERSWEADKNPNSPESQAFYTAYGVDRAA